MKEKILSLTQRLMKIESITHTESESYFEEELMKIILEIDYFQKHPEYVGFQEIDDEFNRKNVYALLKGKGNKTLVLINHHDVVNLDAYGCLQEVAYDSEALKKALEAETSQKEVLDDIHSNEWLFGRGSCDMKGGMAVELAILEKYSLKEMDGNLLFLSVCDEETYSKGMRYAQKLLRELKEKYDLQYVFALNPEPSAHVRQGHVGSFGSIGKCQALVHVAGIPSHISAIEKAVNPISLLHEIVRLIEYSEDFIDRKGKEVTTPPVFNFFHDSKDFYDYSVSHYAAASCSIMSFHSSLAQINEKLTEKCEKGIERYHERMAIKMKNAGRRYVQRKIPVYTFSQVKEICEKNGVLPKMNLNEEFLYEGSRYIEQCLEAVPQIQPCVVITFIPPYYPAISSLHIDFESVRKVAAVLDEQLRKENCHLQKENYFQGVSDGSYFRHFEKQDIKALMYNEKEYYIDSEFEDEIPVLVCGPWGKDLHLKSERVHIHSLCVTCPNIVESIILTLL